MELYLQSSVRHHEAQISEGLLIPFSGFKKCKKFCRHCYEIFKPHFFIFGTVTVVTGLFEDAAPASNVTIVIFNWKLVRTLPEGAYFEALFPSFARRA